MKLLVDENVSWRLVAALQATFPGSMHVSQCGLKGASDIEIWQYAKTHAFTLLTKDADFRTLAFMYGAPPKVIAICIGICSVTSVKDFILNRIGLIQAFERDEAAAMLLLDEEA